MRACAPFVKSSLRLFKLELELWLQMISPNSWNNYYYYLTIFKSTWRQLCTLRNKKITILKMNRVRFNYSLKNIGLPTQNGFHRSLLQKVESVTQRMRWNAHFYLNGETKKELYFYGLPSNHNAPPVSVLKPFEDDLVKLVQNISFRKINEPYLNTLNKDLKNINTSKNVYVLQRQRTFTKYHSPNTTNY